MPTGSDEQLNSILLACLLLVFIVAGLAIVTGVFQTNTDVGIASSGNSLHSRLTLYQYAIDLAKEYRLIGGGLGSFSGLYSSYILLLPVPVFFYSHNLYLDIWIEQGILGLVAWSIILAGSIWLVGKYVLEGNNKERDHRLMGIAILVGLFTFSLHGMIDNPIYAGWGRPLMFVLPGLAMGVAGSNNIIQQSNRISSRITSKKQKIFAIIVLFVMLITIILFHGPVLAAWNANLGVISMAKVQLIEWPSGKWPDKRMGEQLLSARTYLDMLRNLQSTESGGQLPDRVDRTI